MRRYLWFVLFVSLIFVTDAQLPFVQRGLGGNLGITQCSPKTNPSATIPASFDARETWPDCIQPIRDQVWISFYCKVIETTSLNINKN